MGFLEKYSDFASADAWRQHNLLCASKPVCTFQLIKDGKLIHSNELDWSMSVGKTVTYTDFEKSDKPVKRYETPITYVASEVQLKVVIKETRYDHYPVVEYEPILYNLADRPSPEIKDIQPIDRPVLDTANEYTVHYMRGALCMPDDFKPMTEIIKEGQPLSIRERSGRPTNKAFPQFNIEDPASSRGVIAVVSWQGTWLISIGTNEKNAVFTAGQYDTDFVLLAQESFRLPAIVLLYYHDADFQIAQNIWRRWVLDHNLFRKCGRRDFDHNVYFCSGFDGTESDLRGLEQADAVGFEGFNCSLEYDAGWYDQMGEDWFEGTGNWYPNERYSEDGFKQISEKTRQMGWTYSMWFEPERAMKGSRTCDDLKDGMIFISEDGQKVVPYEEAPRLSLGCSNYGNPKTRRFFTDLLDCYFTKYEIGLYRQDHNYDPREHWTAYDHFMGEQYGFPRKGITENHSATGYLTIWDELIKRHPNLIFDVCASGGRRYDLASMRFGFAHTKSDYWLEQVSQQCQNFGFMSWCHFSGTCFTDRDDYDIRTRLTRSIAVSMGDGADYEGSKHALTEWKKYTKYLFNDYYQLTEYDETENGRIAMQFNDDERDEGMMIAYLRSGGFFVFMPRALQAETNYQIWDHDAQNAMKTVSGKSLLSDGFSVDYPKGEKKAVVVWYRKAD